MFGIVTVGWLVLVVSSLVARKVPMKQTAKIALAWVAIFTVGFTLFAFRGEFSALGSRLKSELLGTPVVSGETIRIPIGQDGHFWATASVNGVEGRFLVDSGATITTIGQGFAERAGLRIEPGGAIVETANGTVVMDRGRAGTFALGPIGRDELRVHVSKADETNVIGMNFLSSLSNWRVEGSDLVLQP
jgi:aspartyl protease family protein